MIEMEQLRLTFTSPVERAIDIIQEEYESVLKDEEMLFMVELLEQPSKVQVFVRLKPEFRSKWIRRALSMYVIEGGGGRTQLGDS
jgi:hypothetical protein